MAGIRSIPRRVACIHCTSWHDAPTTIIPFSNRRSLFSSSSSTNHYSTPSSTVSPASTPSHAYFMTTCARKWAQILACIGQSIRSAPLLIRSLTSSIMMLPLYTVRQDSRRSISVCIFLQLFKEEVSPPARYPRNLECIPL